MIRAARMLSIKIPISVMSQDQADGEVEVVVLEPPKPAETVEISPQGG